jgi:hypothetical protein
MRPPNPAASQASQRSNAIPPYLSWVGTFRKGKFTCQKCNLGTALCSVGGKPLHGVRSDLSHSVGPLPTQAMPLHTHARKPGRPLFRRSTFCHLSWLEMLVNVVLRLPPSVLTTAMMATEMPAAIRPYSIAVAPDRSVQNRIKCRYTQASWLSIPPRRRAACAPRVPFL